MTLPIRLLLAAMLVAAVLAAACGDNASTTTPDSNPTATTTNAFPMDVERSDGKTLTLEAPPQRIVSLSPAHTEIIYALGANDTLAAVDRNANYPQAAADFEPKVDAYEPNVESIAALDPDLVIVVSDTSGLVDALDRLNIPVLFADLNEVRTVEDAFGQIELLGRITDHHGEADAMLEDLRGRLTSVQQTVESIPADERPTVYHELDETFYSVADQTFIGDLYRILGAENVAGDGGGNPYPQLTQEAIINANPDVIVLGDEAFGVSVDSVKARPGWDAIDAVKHDRVYGVDPDVVSRPGPRIIDALEELAQKLYPERF